MAEVKWPRSFQDATELPVDQVSAIVEALIAELDRRDGDIEAEPGTWHESPLSRYRLPDGIEDESVEDDPEGFDPEEDMCLAGDDRVTSGFVSGANSLADLGAGDADDAECNGPPSLCDWEILP